MRQTICNAVYNSRVSPMSSLHPRAARRSRAILPVAILLFTLTTRALATDWSGAEQQLARKIAAVTGPGAVAITVDNRSSLATKDVEAIRDGLRAEFATLGLRPVNPEQAAATVAVSLSENPAAYVWVAQIHQGAGESSMVMISSPRTTETQALGQPAAALTIRKIPLWTQEEQILDVAVLEENTAPTRIAVLDPERVVLYRLLGGKWQQEQLLGLPHTRPWPLDLRGRLLPGGDHLLDIYLPGVLCRSTAGWPLSLTCRDSDDPWPLNKTMPGAGTAFPSTTSTSRAAPTAPTTQLNAFFAPTRNFFTGVLSPGIGKFANVPKFYSAAPLPREKYVLWLLAAVDGQVHLIDGVSDQAAKPGWGSDLASDSVRAYEFPDRDAIAVSAPADFSGGITALWRETKGDTAVAVARNHGTRNYEAFRLAVACGQ
jgi:hypothetical protein